MWTDTTNFSIQTFIYRYGLINLCYWMDSHRRIVLAKKFFWEMNTVHNQHAWLYKSIHTACVNLRCTQKWFVGSFKNESDSNKSFKKNSKTHRHKHTPRVHRPNADSLVHTHTVTSTSKGQKVERYKVQKNRSQYVVKNYVMCYVLNQCSLC